jgi:hypothetical protein
MLKITFFGSKEMDIFTETERKLAINKSNAFCELNSNQLPNKTELFGDVFNKMDAAIHKTKSELPRCQNFPSITQGALNNCHGDWYEWFLAITAINIHLSQKTKYLALLLPNVSTFDVAELYGSEILTIVNDLKHKVKGTSSVEFITSNPDFVIIDTTNVDTTNLTLNFNTPISVVDPTLIQKIQGLYTHFIGKCALDDIVGYLSVKTSLRPDRRLQIAHEGSLMKALYAHIQTRQWILKPNGLKYYAASKSVSSADRAALKTIATHSLITVNTAPQPAVDEVYEIDSLKSAEAALLSILNS